MLEQYISQTHKKINNTLSSIIKEVDEIDKVLNDVLIFLNSTNQTPVVLKLKNKIERIKHRQETKGAEQ